MRRRLKSGFNFALGAGNGSTPGPNDCNGTGTNSAWLATATAQTFGTTGTRQFAVNAGNTVWQSTTVALPAEPFTASATVAPIQ